VAAGAAGGAEAAFRIEEEHPCRDDPLAFFETASDFDAVGQLHAERHRARLEPIAGGDKDVLLQAGINDGITRNGDDLRPGRFERDGPIETRPQAARAIGNGQADPQRARALGERGVDEIDARRKRRSARRGEVE
jgi:hypothetical protein